MRRALLFLILISLAACSGSSLSLTKPAVTKLAVHPRSTIVPTSLQFGAGKVWYQTYGSGDDLIHWWALGDVTGDGTSDLVEIVNTPIANDTFQQIAYVATSLLPKQFGTTHQQWAGNPCPQPSECNNFGVGDVNGDGKADLIMFAAGTTETPDWANVWVSLSNGTSFGPPQKWSSDFCITGQFCRVADVDGDGKADLIAFNVQTGQVWVALSTGSSFGATTMWQNYFCIVGEKCFVRDVDGDGKADLIDFKPHAPGAQQGNVLVALSSGSGFGSAQIWHGFFCVNLEKCLIGDFNGDGKIDIALLKQWGLDLQALVALSDGTHFVNTTPFSWNDAVSGDTLDPMYESADVTGDKKADLVTYKRSQSSTGGTIYTFVVYPTQAVTQTCPPGQVLNPSTNQCIPVTNTPVTNPQGISQVQIYNCNTNMDDTGDHRPVTLYLRDASVSGPYMNQGTIDAQYNIDGSCPYNDDGTLASPEATINLIPYNSHTVQIVAVDPGLAACGGQNDPNVLACIVQTFTYPANSKGSSLTIQVT